MSTRDRLLRPFRSATGVISKVASQRTVLGTIAAVIVLLTVLPLLFLLWTAVWSGFPGEFDATFTLANAVAVYLEGFFDVPELFINWC